MYTKTFLDALRDGKFRHALVDSPGLTPNEIAPGSIVHISDHDDDGPGKFNAEPLLTAASHIVLAEAPMLLKDSVAIDLASKGAKLVVISCSGSTFLWWWNLLQRSDLKKKTLALGSRNPNRKLDS